MSKKSGAIQDMVLNIFSNYRSNHNRCTVLKDKQLLNLKRVKTPVSRGLEMLFFSNHR
jgi:hypothetical protein